MLSSCGNNDWYMEKLDRFMFSTILIMASHFIWPWNYKIGAILTNEIGTTSQPSMAAPFAVWQTRRRRQRRRHSDGRLVLGEMILTPVLDTASESEECGKDSQDSVLYSRPTFTGKKKFCFNSGLPFPVKVFCQHYRVMQLVKKWLFLSEKATRKKRLFFRLILLSPTTVKD